MNSEPFFSIITPTYKRERFLTKMITCVQVQSYQNYEHIIIDDGSTDDTKALVSTFTLDDSKIIYIKQENRGRSAARNVGINTAKGEYICFLDSDDVWADNYLEELAKRASSSGFLMTKMIWVNEKTGRWIPRPVEPFLSSEPKKVIELQVGMNVCLRRTLFEGCLFNEGLSFNEDFELWTRIICHKNLAVSDVPKSHYLVTTPESLGKTTISQLDGMVRAQKIMMSNPVVAARIEGFFWRKRTKSMLLLRIRAYEEMDNSAGLILSILRFLISYPSEKNNKSLLVTLLYNLPGGSVLKRLIKGSKQSAG